ncbi:MAG: hypothetical protein AB1349_02290 [Elusimicrobiota bacterium]
MIEKWEIIPYPSERYPDRYKVSIKCDYNTLKKITDFYGKKCGLPWKPKNSEFNFSFYLYQITPQDVEKLEAQMNELQHLPTKTEPAVFHPEPRSNIFPPRASTKQPTTEEVKVAKEMSDIIDFDIFEPEKLNSIELPKETKQQKIVETERSTISVGIIFRSGQEEYANTIEKNLLQSVSGRKLKFQIKIVFKQGYLVFSDEDIENAISLCKKQNVTAVVVNGESKLAEILQKPFQSAGIYIEHIKPTDVDKKSIYFNIATNIILAETEKSRIEAREL